MHCALIHSSFARKQVRYKRALPLPAAGLELVDHQNSTLTQP